MQFLTVSLEPTYFFTLKELNYKVQEFILEFANFVISHSQIYLL